MKYFLSIKRCLILLISVYQLANPSTLFAQCKTFSINSQGDTLNCVDMHGLKQGKWTIHIPELRGEPGHEEEGVFLNGRKEGIWRNFSTGGDVESVQTYKWGLLNGKSQYYTLQGLEREENWWAIDPNKLYDTIDVPNLYQPDKTHTVVVKNEGYSMKHGKWVWYDPMTGFVQNTEEYIRDSAVNPLQVFGIGQTSRTKRLPKDTAASKNKKPFHVQEWEKKNSNKKKVKFQDGSTGN